MRAVEGIRRARDKDHRDGFPQDLGCDTQLYLGAAVYAAFPDERISTVALVCAVPVADGLFFAELIELALAGTWMEPQIIGNARADLLGVARPFSVPPREPFAVLVPGRVLDAAAAAHHAHVFTRRGGLT